MQPSAASCLWSPQCDVGQGFSLPILIQLLQPHPVTEASQRPGENTFGHLPLIMSSCGMHSAILAQQPQNISYQEARQRDSSERTGLSPLIRDANGN